MPNKHGQVTRDDFVAPQGMLRIMLEDMEDGELKILSDYYDEEFAFKSFRGAMEEDLNNMYTLCDENGPIDD